MTRLTIHQVINYKSKLVSMRHKLAVSQLRYYAPPYVLQLCEQPKF